MNQHTPGPWEYLPTSGVYATKVGQCIVSGLSGRTHDEAEANARLIAAAPEMEETLRKFVTYYTPPAKTATLGNGEAAQHFQRARALLARIDGGA